MFNQLIFFKRHLLLLFTIIGLVQLAVFYGVEKLNQHELSASYQMIANKTKAQIHNAIRSKQKSTTAIALTLSAGFSEQIQLQDSHYDASFKELIKRITNYSDFKNLWVQILSPEGEAFYRNWTPIRNNVRKIRNELQQVQDTGKPSNSISTGYFDLTIKITTPIHDQQKNLIGYLELISHFNSIQRLLERQKIESLTIATEERSKVIKAPFTPHKIGEHYVANKKPNLALLEQVSPKRLKNWLQNHYSIWQDYLVVPYPLKDIEEVLQGHVIAFVPLVSLQQTDSADFPGMLKLWLIALDITLIIALVMGVAIYLVMRQKRYYQDVINAEEEMVLVTNGAQFLDGNTQLFRYFPKLGKSQNCICDAFIKEEGFLQKQMGENLWTEFLASNPNIDHKAKVIVNGMPRILQLKAKKLDTLAGAFVVVLMDISHIESLHHQLLEKSLTDELTQVGNRRAFNEKLESISHSEHEFCLISFDVDHFKQVNDTYGHAVGDLVLQQVSKVTTEYLRSFSAELYRVGGEEFMITYQQSAEILEAEQLAENIRLLIQNEFFNEAGKVTISLGVSCRKPGLHVSELLSQADSALYQAKEAGRNRVKLAE